MAIDADVAGDTASVDPELPEVAAQRIGVAREVQVGSLDGCPACGRWRIPLRVEHSQVSDEGVKTSGEARGGDDHSWTDAHAAREHDVGVVEGDDGGDDIDFSPLQCSEKTDVQDRKALVGEDAGVQPSVRWPDSAGTKDCSRLRRMPATRGCPQWASTLERWSS